jgi:hypothetical protein
VHATRCAILTGVDTIFLSFFLCPTVDAVKAVNDKMAAGRAPLSAEESEVATELVRGHRIMEVSGRDSPEASYLAP